MKINLLMITPFLALACTSGADEGRRQFDTTTTGPDGHQSSRNRVSGPNGTFVELGPDAGTGTRDAGFPPGNAPGVKDGSSAPIDQYQECVDSCLDEGYPKPECDSFCGGGPVPGDGDEPGGCEGLDECLRCLCEQGETTDFDLCTPPCEPL